MCMPSTDQDRPNQRLCPTCKRPWLTSQQRQAALESGMKIIEQIEATLNTPDADALLENQDWLES